MYIIRVSCPSHLNFIDFFELVQCPITVEFCIRGEWKHKWNYCTVTIYLLRQPNQNKRQLNKFLLRLLVFIPIRYFQLCFLAHLMWLHFFCHKHGNQQVGLLSSKALQHVHQCNVAGILFLTDT
jgi:hypothetical protein